MVRQRAREPCFFRHTYQMPSGAATLTGAALICLSMPFGRLSETVDRNRAETPKNCRQALVGVEHAMVRRGVSATGLGGAAHEKLITPGVLLIGTVPRDGSARISGVEPLIMAGELWLSVMRGSAKALDLYRDPRIVLNRIVVDPGPAVEIKIRGTARREPDEAVHERLAAAVAAELGWQPVVGRFALFAVSIEDVTYIGYDLDTHGQHVARWPAGEEFIRPATTPSSLGPRQGVRRRRVRPPRSD